jgi:hypothetical protein
MHADTAAGCDEDVAVVQRVTELSFHGIDTSRQNMAKSDTHVSGTNCHLSLGPLIILEIKMRRPVFETASSPHLYRPLSDMLVCADTWGGC